MRRANWQAALDQFLAENRRRVFAYGSWDCCLFACDAIETMTGVDPAAEYRGAYASRKAAMREVRSRTGAASVKAVAEAVTEEYGMPPISVLLAGRGDLMLLNRSNGWSLGIVALNGREIVVAALQGMVRIPLSAGARGWQV